MRILGATLAVLALSTVLCSQDVANAPGQANSSVAPAATPSSDASPTVTAPAASTPSEQTAGQAIVPPPPTERDIAIAKRQFATGTKLKAAGKTQAAFDQFEQASQLDPRNVDYLTAREVTRQQLVMDALERGNQEMLAKNEAAAAAEFQRALEFDPTNQFARQRLSDSTWEGDKAPSRTLEITQKTIDVRLSPSTERKDFHYRGDSRTLLTQIARAYGITATIDDSVQTRQLHFNIENVTFAEAMEAATRATKTFWIALSGSQMYVVSDTVENRRNFERMAIRTFYLSDVLTPQELTDTVNALRVLLDIRFVQQDAAESTITIRAPLTVVEAASQLIESLAGGKPQLMLDVRVYQISSNLVRQMGTQLPTNFNRVQYQPDIAGITGAGRHGRDQPTDCVRRNQPGKLAGDPGAAGAGVAGSAESFADDAVRDIRRRDTLTGLSGTPPIGVKLNVNESDVHSLEHVTLADIAEHAGGIEAGPAISDCECDVCTDLQHGRDFAGAGQSVIHERRSLRLALRTLGLNMKATPIIHSNTDVNLKIEINIRTLGGQSVNGIPIINNREYVGSISLKNDEAGVIAGFLSKADSLSLSGYPFLSRVPAVNYGTAVHDKNVNDDELLIVMTPHIVRMAPQVGFALQLPVGH